MSSTREKDSSNGQFIGSDFGDPTGTLSELQENIRFLTGRLGSIDRVAEAFSKEDGDTCTPETLSAIMTLPIVRPFSSIKDKDGKSANPDDIFPQDLDFEEAVVDKIYKDGMRASVKLPPTEYDRFF